MMEILFLLQPVVLVIGALFVLLRGADVFLDGVLQLGAKLKLSAFVLGALVVGVGTALPELAAALAAIHSGETEMVVASAVGSSIVNILFVVGLMAVVMGRVIIRPQVLTAELPLFVLVHALFFGVVFDGYVTSGEALFLLATCAVYVWHGAREDRLVVPRPTVEVTTEVVVDKHLFRSILFVVIGLIAVLLGANYTVAGVTQIATLLQIPASLMSLTVIALATALPELAVAIQAMRQGQPDIAIGSIFGANIYTLLVVVGVPALFTTLPVSTAVSELGIWCLYAASAVSVIVLMSRQILRSEGIIMVLGFLFFLMHLSTYL